MNYFDPTANRKVWEPNSHPQRALLSCPADEILFGGGKQGGKSDGILGEFYTHHVKYAQYARGLCLRRELKQLRDLINRSREIYTPMGAKYNGGEDAWTFENGAHLMFGCVEQDSDHTKYQGFGITRLYVEELGNFPSPYPLDMLQGNFRSSHPTIPMKFIATSNFIGVGMSWLKQRFIEPAPGGWEPIPYEEEWINPNTKQVERITKYRYWIPSNIFDNPVSNKPKIIAGIKRMGSPKVVQALLYGDPNQIEGAFFPEFESPKGRHVIEPFTIPDSWTRIMGCDYGHASPWANLWIAVVPKDSHLPEPAKIGSSYNHRRYMGNLPSGALVVYRELYIAQRNEYGSHINVGLGYDCAKYAHAIHEIEAKEEAKDREGNVRIAYRIGGHDMFIRRPEPDVAEILRKNHNLSFRKANTERTNRTAQCGVGGWEHLRSLLVGYNGWPMLYVFNTCKDLIRCFPAAQENLNSGEDKLKGEDHNLDALRYIVQSRPKSGFDDRMFAPQPMAYSTGNQMYAHAPGIDDLDI